MQRFALAVLGCAAIAATAATASSYASRASPGCFPMPTIRGGKEQDFELGVGEMAVWGAPAIAGGATYRVYTNVGNNAKFKGRKYDQHASAGEPATLVVCFHEEGGDRSSKPCGLAQQGDFFKGDRSWGIYGDPEKVALIVMVDGHPWGEGGRTWNAGGCADELRACACNAAAGGPCFWQACRPAVPDPGVPDAGGAVAADVADAGDAACVAEAYAGVNHAPTFAAQRYADGCHCAACAAGAGSCARCDGCADDLGRVLAVLDQLAQDYCVDLEQVYAIGLGQGGLAALSMAAARPSPVHNITARGVISISALPLFSGGAFGSAESLRYVPLPPIDRKVSLLHIHGTGDTRFPMQMVPSGPGTPALAAIDTPGQGLRCAATPVSGVDLDHGMPQVTVCAAHLQELWLQRLAGSGTDGPNATLAYNIFQDALGWGGSGVGDDANYACHTAVQTEENDARYTQCFYPSDRRQVWFDQVVRDWIMCTRDATHCAAALSLSPGNAGGDAGEGGSGGGGGEPGQPVP